MDGNVVSAENILYQVAFAAMFLQIGIVLILAAKKGWAPIVDPPEELWWLYSQAFIKKFFGKRVLLYFTYGLGILIIGVAGFDLIITVKNFLKALG